MKYEYVLIIGSFYLLSCEKLVEIDPPVSQVVRSTVFEDELSAIAAINGIYMNMSSFGYASGSFSGISHLCGYSSDELISYNDADNELFFTNSLHPGVGGLSGYLWNPMYNSIYNANAIIEGLKSSEKLSESVKRQLEGEARFIRAFCHFYLVNMFGEIPLVLSTDYRINSSIKPSSYNEIYDQIIKDLNESKDLLEDEYSSGAIRVRPNRTAALALLARVLLYRGDYSAAEDIATAVLNRSEYYLEPDVNNVFLSTSKEAIWQLKPVYQNFTNDASTFLDYHLSSVTLQVVDNLSNTDSRRQNWLISFDDGIQELSLAFKYKEQLTNATGNEYSMILRLAEQYLIRSEARARLNKLALSEDDLNEVRNRAGIGDTALTTEPALIDAIMLERQRELFSEWGHRWFDLKRMKIADAILAQAKGANWQATDTLYPIPQTEIDNNPNLEQNKGYN